MSEEAALAKGVRETASLAKILAEARTLAAEHARALAEVVPAFPEHARPVVTRLVDRRVSEVIYQKAYRTLKASLTQDVHAPLDTVAFRTQRDQVLALRAVLKETGGRWYGNRLVATVDGEVSRRLALMHEDVRQLLLHDARLEKLARWQGEPVLLAQVAGGEGLAGATSMGKIAMRLELMVLRARSLQSLGSRALASDPAVSKWQQLQAELQRYNARASHSSLLRLERYLAAVGTDLGAENCAERLAGVAVPVGYEDVVSQRLNPKSARQGGLIQTGVSRSLRRTDRHRGKSSKSRLSISRRLCLRCFTVKTVVRTVSNCYSAQS